MGDGFVKKPDNLGYTPAIGLNGFQSGTGKYAKNYPIWVEFPNCRDRVILSPAL